MFNLRAEKKIFDLGYETIAGIDEAGRGPLAGPVVAAAVLIDKNFSVKDEDLKKMADSKKLSRQNREKIFKAIKEKILAVEIGVVDNQQIDRLNILQASFLAMKKALKGLKTKPDYVLVDGHYKVPKLEISQSAIIKGDNSVFSIAAASIIAKVSRDWLMSEFNQQYPGYDFDQHKGYGTKLHLEKIKELGPCPIHRLSFAPFTKKIKIKDNKI